MAITRKDIRRNSRAHRSLSLQAHYTAEPVAYQLLQIATSDIGVASGYWLEWQRNDGNAPFDWTPNDVRDKFTATTRAVFKERVDSAYMLRQEQRRAAEMFRGFCDYAAGVDWNDQTAFEQLSELYDRARKSMLAILAEAKRKSSDLQERRMRLMERKGLPYREVTL